MKKVQLILLFMAMLMCIYAQTLDFGIWFDMSAAECDRILQAQGFMPDKVEGMQHRYVPTEEKPELDIILYIEYGSELLSEWIIHYHPTEDPDQLFGATMEMLNDLYGPYTHYNEFMESYVWEVEGDLYFADLGWEYQKESLYLRYYWE